MVRVSACVCFTLEQDLHTFTFVQTSDCLPGLSTYLHGKVYFYTSVQRSVAGGVLFLSCLSVHASRNIVNMISCRVVDAFLLKLRQRCAMGQRWTRNILGSKGQRSRSWWVQYAGKSCLSFHNSSARRHTILHNLASSCIRLVCFIWYVYISSVFRDIWLSVLDTVGCVTERVSPL